MLVVANKCLNETTEVVGDIIDLFMENLDSNCAVRLSVVVAFKSCDCDVICL